MSDKIKDLFSGFETAERKLNIHFGHEVTGKELSVIPTGSLALDDALSSGGLPNGRIIQYYGPPGSGKSLLSLLAIKNAQKLDPDAIQIFFDAENAFDPLWPARLGCDPSRIMVVDGATAAIGRDAFELLLGVPKEDAKTHMYVGQSNPGILDKIIDGSLNCNLIVYDSLGQCIPPGEDTSRVGKMNMALLSRFLTTTFRKLSLALSRANVPFICINHKRDNMDPYGVDHTFSGGNTYAHSLSANVYFERISRKDSAIFDGNEEIIGSMVRATIEKSKFGPWPRKCEFTVDFNEGIINQHEEIAELALKYDVVKKPTSMSYEYDNTKWVGMNKYCEALKDDPALADKLSSEIADLRKKKASRNVEEQEKVTEEVAVKATKGRPKKALS